MEQLPHDSVIWQKPSPHEAEAECEMMTRRIAARISLEVTLDVAPMFMDEESLN